MTHTFVDNNLLERLTIKYPSLEYKTSNIPFSGNGVFTKNFIPKDTLIGTWDGKRYTELKNGIKNYVYSFTTNREITIDPFDDCIFRYINDIINVKKSIIVKHTSKTLNKDLKIFNIKSVNHNVEWYIKIDRQKMKSIEEKLGKNRFLDDEYINHEIVYIKATKDIYSGEELFIDYGREYWVSRIQNPLKMNIIDEDIYKWIEEHNLKNKLCILPKCKCELYPTNFYNEIFEELYEEYINSITPGNQSYEYTNNDYQDMYEEKKYEQEYEDCYEDCNDYTLHVI